MKLSKYLSALPAALLISTAAFAQTSTGTPTGSTSGGTTGTTTGSTTGTTDKHGKANPHTPNEHASDVSKAVQTVLQQFDAKRDKIIADRKALIEKLEAATTEAERKAIRAEIKAANDAQKAERAQLGKEIRDEVKNLREQRKGGG